MAEQKKYYAHERPELVAEVDMQARCVLDIGCGEGNISAAIKRDRGAGEVWGVEVVPEVAQRAQENPALDRVFSGDITGLVDELPEAGFSHIVAGDVLEHLVDPWTALASLKTRLEPGGKFICSLPNIRNLSFISQLLFGGRFEYKDAGVLDRTHLRFFTRKEIELMFTGAGFTNVKISAVRPKKKLIKQVGRALFGDLVLKGFLVTARRPPGNPAT